MTDIGREIEEQRKREKPATLGYFYFVGHSSANRAQQGVALWSDGNWYFPCGYILDKDECQIFLCILLPLCFGLFLKEYKITLYG